MTDFVRVRIQESGHETTVARSTAEALDGLEILDHADAVDALGRPLPDTHGEASTAAPDGTVAADTSPYDDRKVAELKNLIDSRNEGRDDADLIVPEGRKHGDLVAALVADDARPAPEQVVTTTVGVPAEQNA